jgi:hypothetical protein
LGKEEQMPRHDFSELWDKYPEIIAIMPDNFTSHRFILTLAQKYQKLYIEALYAYRDVTHQGAQAPFRIVHGILSRRLHDFDRLVAPKGTAYRSKDIFGHRQQCARWRKRHQ